MRAFAAAIALVVVAACSPQPQSSAPSTPEIRVTDSTPGTGVAAVSIVGLPAEDLAAIRSGSFTSEEWNSILRVIGDSGPDTRGLPAVAGSYEVANGTLRFLPALPLDPHVAHRVIFDPTQLPRHLAPAAQPWRSRPMELPIAATLQQGPPTTRVVQVFPTDTLLENQLRIYIHFSAPMGARRANDYVRLLNDQGQVVEDAFLPLDVSFWSPDHTRYTLLFDPGRVKRGILPNKEMGRPLVPGRRYTLVVDRDWRDGLGRPLVEAFRREFHVVPAVFEPIVPTDWHLDVPVAGTRDPLNVRFPRALDHAIVAKALFLTEADGQTVDGSVTVDDASTRWTFTPLNVWRSGEYRLGTLSVLEDPAGNRVGRAFDFDPRQPGSAAEDRGDTHAHALMPFTVSPPGVSQRR